MKKTADSMIKKNEEYTKLRSQQETDKAPREQPSGQSPGSKSHGKADYTRWTDEELRAHAAELGAPDAEARDRDELIDYLREHAGRPG